MSENSESLVRGSSRTKQNDKQKSTSQNISGSNRNESQRILGQEENKNTDVVTQVTRRDSSNYHGPSGQKIFGLQASVSPLSAAVNLSESQHNSRNKKGDTSLTPAAKNIFQEKNDSVPEKNLPSNAKDAAPEKSHNQSQTNAAKDVFAGPSLAPRSSGSVSQTPRSGVSSSPSEHSSEKDTETGQLQSKTTSKGKTSSASDIYAPQQPQKK